MTATYLVQDIETIPETELQDMWLEEKAKLELAGKPAAFEALWAHKVICIGMLALDENLHPMSGGCALGGLVGCQSESAMVRRWSDVVSGKYHGLSDSLRMVDWNGSKFDVPVLQTRAFHYGIPLPWLFALQPDNRGSISAYSKEYRDKYGGKHDDVSELWTNRGSFIKPHLANLARAMGLPGKGGIDGSKVYQAYKDGLHAEIDLYCMQDVIQTAFVFQRFRFLCGRLSLAQYSSAATALLAWVDGRPEQQAFAQLIDRAAVLLA